MSVQYVDTSRFGVAAFNPETDVTWHSLWWAEGTDFAAQGYSDTDAVGTWPNETGESDATQATAGNKPLYVASETALNSQPAVDFVDSTDLLKTSAYTTDPTAPYSLVAIGKCTTGAWHTVMDGLTNRAVIGMDGTPNDWTIFAGTSVYGGTPDANAHLWVAVFDGSTGNDVLYVDGTGVINASAGSSVPDGATLGNNPAGGFAMEGPASLFGVYEGDVTADGAWSDFETWVTDHYGITIA